MRKIALVLVLALALASVAVAQSTVTVDVKPGSCVSLGNCLLFANDGENGGQGSLVWTSGESFLMFNSNPSTGLGLYATEITEYDLAAAPGTDRTQRYPFVLHVVGSDIGETFVLDLHLYGYRYYQPSRGGRGGGGAGWRYAVTSGSITVTQ